MVDLKRNLRNAGVGEVVRDWFTRRSNIGNRGMETRDGQPHRVPQPRPLAIHKHPVVEGAGVTVGEGEVFPLLVAGEPPAALDSDGTGHTLELHRLQLGALVDPEDVPVHTLRPFAEQINENNEHLALVGVVEEADGAGLGRVAVHAVVGGGRLKRTLRRVRDGRHSADVPSGVVEDGQGRVGDEVEVLSDPLPGLLDEREGEAGGLELPQRDLHRVPSPYHLTVVEGRDRAVPPVSRHDARVVVEEPWEKAPEPRHLLVPSLQGRQLPLEEGDGEEWGQGWVIRREEELRVLIARQRLRDHLRDRPR